MSKEVRRVLCAAAGALALVLALGLGGCTDAWRILTTGEFYWEDDDGDDDEEGEGNSPHTAAVDAGPQAGDPCKEIFHDSSVGRGCFAPVSGSGGPA
jgi:hypothetical protein